MIPPTPRRSPASPVRGLALALMVLGLAAAGMVPAATKIYRTVDEHGNVVFTDVPPKNGEQGEAVDLNRGSTFTPPVEPAADSGDTSRSVESWLNGEDPDESADPQPSGYATLQVADPPHDAPVRDNAGNVTVTAAVEPTLHESHIMQVYLDGQLRASGPASSFQLTNLDRGTHRVSLRIVDAAGNTLATSEPSVFHLQRRSVILQPARGSGSRSN